MLEHGPQQHARLEQRELVAETTVHTAAERQPGVGLGSRAQKAFGPKGQRVGVQVGALVQCHDRDDDVCAGWDEQPVEVEGPLRTPTGDRQRRAQPQRLGDDRVKVAVLATVDALLERSEHVGLVDKQVGQPAEGDRGDGVAGQHQPTHRARHERVVMRLILLLVELQEHGQAVVGA